MLIYVTVQRKECNCVHVLVIHPRTALSFQSPPLQSTHPTSPLISGRYTDEVEAAKAYDKAAYYLYGDAAITNFGLEAVRKDTTEVLGGFDGNQ